MYSKSAFTSDTTNDKTIFVVHSKFASTADITNDLQCIILLEICSHQYDVVTDGM